MSSTPLSRLNLRRHLQPEQLHQRCALRRLLLDLWFELLHWPHNVHVIAREQARVVNSREKRERRRLNRDDRIRRRATFSSHACRLLAITLPLGINTVPLLLRELIGARHDAEMRFRACEMFGEFLTRGFPVLAQEIAGHEVAVGGNVGLGGDVKVCVTETVSPFVVGVCDD